jgi:hypothetical protein
MCLPDDNDLSLKFVGNIRNINGLLFYKNFVNWLQYVGDWDHNWLQYVGDWGHNWLQYVGDWGHNARKNKITILERGRLFYDISTRVKKIKFEALNWIP